MESYSNYQTTKQQLQVTAGIRLVSMLMDHIIMSFLSVLFFMPVIFIEIISRHGHHGRHHMHATPGNYVYIGIIGLAIYLCKDSFNGRSPAKRIFKLQVVDYRTRIAANPLQCFVRNILIILWPIEVIV